MRQTPIKKLYLQKVCKCKSDEPMIGRLVPRVYLLLNAISSKNILTTDTSTEQRFSFLRGTDATLLLREFFE